METWFTETFGDLSASWRIRNILYSGRSQYQQILVVDTIPFGKMLVLDGCVMTTEKDEFVYHEMLSHLALLSHPNPKSVCIVGGGDGGTMREVLKHSSVERSVLAEIDGEVIRVCQQFFPELANCLTDSRVELAVGDGFKYLAENQNAFDIILSDSTDPVGPGAALFDDDYFRLAKSALHAGGCFVTQCKSVWTDVEVVHDIIEKMKKHFKIVLPYAAPIPTYPTGYWSFLLASDSTDPRTHFHVLRQNEIVKSTRYYTAEHQQAAFVMPAFFYAAGKTKSM